MTMRGKFLGLLVALVLVSACGATTSGTSTTAAAAPALSGATVDFRTLQDGKDTGSAVTVQLLRRNNEIGAELRSVGSKFDDNSQSAPLAMSVSGPFLSSDVNDGQVRLRLTPDGRDTWTLDMRLILTFADGTQRTFAWQGLRLDERAPERTLALAPAGV
jgi:hypothetical protein